MKSKRLLLTLLMALLVPWAANAQTRVTQTFNFEDNAIPTTWTNDATYPWVVTDAAANGGTYSIKSGNYHVGSSTSSISATFTFAGDGSISFAVRCSSEQTSTSYDWDYGTFYIDGVQQGDKIVNSTTFSTLNYEVEAGEHTFMWKYKKDSSVDNNDDCLYVDDVVVDLGVAGAAPRPTGFAVSNILHNQADLSWTENGTATSWQICVNDDETNLITVTENPYTLTGLTPLTAYTVKVRSVGTPNSNWTSNVSFTTTAQATAVGDSWSDDFEGASCDWELINGTLTNQWAWGTAANNGGTHGLYISNDGGTSNAYSHSTAIVYATKLLNFTEGKFEFAYDWKANGESNYDYLRVALVPASVTLTAGTMPSGFSYYGLPTGWIALDGGSKLNQVTAWQSKSLAINVTAGNYYLVMAWRNDGGGGTQPPAAVDNVSITRMACPYDVTDLAVSNIATTTADIAWTNGDPGEWQVAIKEGADEWEIFPTTFTTNGGTLTGLTASTTYQVRVRAYCNANDQGSWCDPISFATECEAFDLSLEDYSENFDSYTAATGFLPICWSRINEGTNTSYNKYPYVYSYGANSGSNCLRLYAYGTNGTSDQYAILPEMENMEGKQITLWAKGYNAGNTFKIGMMSDPTDATTFVVIGEKTLTTSYEECSFILGRGNYVAFLMEAPTSSTTFGIYIDDITIADVPTCLKPSDLTFVSATTTEATLSWTNGAEGQTAWQIAYSTDPAFDPDEVTPVDVTSNPGTIDGLTAATTYYAYVRANCGNNGYSDWSSAYCMFTTECEAITNLPWSENFDAYTGSTGSTAPAGYPNDQLPTCWQFLNRSENSSTYPQVFISSSSGYPVSGKCLFFKSSSTTPLYAILPEFSEDIANLQLTFTYRNEGTNTNNGTLIVGYMTDPTDATTFTEKHTCERTTTLTEQEVLFTDAPAGSYIAFKYQGGSSNNYYLSIDNVSVNYPPTCTKPTALEWVSSTTTTATLSWTNGAATQTAWQIAYSTDPAFDPDEVTPVDVTSNPGTISGLTAATTYYAYVRANCGNDDYSDWSNEISFATECEVVVVDAAHPFTEGFEGTTFAPLCWESIASGSYTWNRNTGYKHTGSASAYSGYYGDIYLVMPDLQISNEGISAQLTFWSYNTYPSDYDKNSVILLDGENETELWSPETVSESWVPTTVDLTQYMGQTISLAFKYEGSNAHGWYIDDVCVAIVQTFQKEITGYGDSEHGGYYLIASPLADNIDPTTINNMVVTDPENEAYANYDLYSFDQAQDDFEWRNYKAYAFNLVNGKGYLYANKNDVTLNFTGVAYTGNGVFDLTWTAAGDEEWRGWNLVGNPFGETATVDRSFYVMNDGRYEIVAALTNVIEPMQGIFVIATADGENLTFTPASANIGGGSGVAPEAAIALNITESNGLVDRAIVNFGGERSLPKFQLNPNHTKVYIPMNGKDYAVVSAGNVGEMPVSFKAEKNGSYTLSFTSQEVSFSYLHLIDNMTGADVNLLETPSYSFSAQTTDYASRFRLVFATGSSATDDSFAFINGMGNLSIFGIEGEATVQVMDVLGHMVSSNTFSGSYEQKLNVAPGVYMIRLINGNDVKVQKMVIR